MADVNADIGVNIDTTAALAQLKSLQRQISQFHTSIARSSDTAALAQKSLQKNFLNSVNAIGSFSAELRTVKTTTESFTSSLEGNKFSMREYFRYAGGATKTFGKLFKSEFDTIGKVAEERVRRLQTQYIKMGRDASGAMQAISITPTSLDMQNYGTKTAIAAQKQALFNQLMKQGSTSLLNFGKNTQWAGRQLMVGFTIPLAMVGSAATKTFMDMEAQAIKFKKVYGDLFTPAEETQQALDSIVELGKSFTQYGIAVSDTVGLAAEAAAAGFSGLDLQRQTTEASRLSILGQIDNQKALETTISLQNSFGMSSDKLADSINFLNAVENQTVVSLDDITTAIPKVAPVIQQLGGDVKDLTFFIAAMKEGGINASEGANALKSGLAALINPTGKASAMLAQFGINAKEIVTRNKGDLKTTVVEFATALNQLDPLNRAQAIEQMFGKFQFARLSTLFANVAKDGNQAARVLDLANTSVEELSSLSEQELGMTAESSMNKFKKTIEDLKIALVPVGKAFLEAVTPIVEFAANILEKFSNLSDGTKKAITLMVTVIGGLGPIILMTFGLLANGVANIIKLFLTLRNGYLRLTGQSQVLGEQTQYLTMEQIDAAAASHSLNQAHATLTQQFTVEASAVMKLKAAYEQATAAGAKFALNNPGSMLPRGRGYANGVVSVPGSGKGDTVPAMLTPGEAVIPAAMAKKYAPLINGMIAGNIPGYEFGKTGAAQSDDRAEFKKVKVPGAMNMAHFGEKRTMTGQQLLDMSKTLDEVGRKQIEKLVASITNGVEETFRVFDNRVVAQLDVINNAMDKKGKASLQLVKENTVGDKFAKVRDVELQTQLEAAGVPLQEIQEINQQLTDKMSDGFTRLGEKLGYTSEEIESGYDKLGNEITITSDELDKIIREAYEAVAATNENVRKAYEEMQKVRAAYEPQTEKGVRSKRVALVKGSYLAKNKKTRKDPDSTYREAQTRMVGEGNNPYPALSDFGINEEMIAGLGLTIEQAQAKFKELSDTVKVELSKLAGNSKEFAVALKSAIDEAEASGVELGQAAVKSVAKGAQTASDSKATTKTGQDIGRGLESGMESRKDDVAAKGTELGQVATQSVARGSKPPSRGARSTGPITPGEQYDIQKTQGGIPISQVTRNMPVSPEIVQKAALQARMMQISTDRLQKFDRNIMGASFAVSSLSSLASMSGGKFGELSGTIAKVTGALFALQAVTSLLTQTKLLQLAQDRLGIASTAMKMAKGGGGLAPMAGIKGTSGIMGSIARVGFGLAKFVGPLGLLTLGATAAYVAFKFIKKTQEEARLKVQGLGEAALLTSEQLGKLAPLLGFTEGKSPFANVGKETKVVAAPQRQKIDEIKTTLKEDKTFQQNIKSIKEATDKQIQSVLTAQSVSLLAQGAPKENVQAYINALLEEAGKAKIEFKVASIDLSSKEGQKRVVKDTTAQVKNFNKVYAQSIANIRKKVQEGTLYFSSESAFLAKVQSDMMIYAQKNTTLIPNALVANLGALKTNLETGKISLEEYNAAVSGLVGSLQTGEGGLLLAKNTIKEIALAGKDEALANAASGITKNADAILVLQAATAGIPDIISLINALKVLDSPGATPAAIAAASQVITKAKIALSKRAAEQAEASKVSSYVEPKDTGAPEKSPFEQATDQLKNQRTEMLNTVKTYGILTKSGVSAGKAFAIAKDPILAAAVATTKVGTKKWKELIKLIKETDAALLKSKLTELRADRDYTKQFTAIVPVLKELGLNASEIENIFADPSFAQQFIKNVKNGKIEVKDLKDIITVTMQDRTAKLNFETSLKSEDELFDEAMNKANEMFDKVQTGIEASYRGQIKSGEVAVEKAQQAVEDIQKEIDDIQTTINKKQRDLEIDITREIEKFQADIDKLQNDIKIKFEEPLSKLSDEGDILSNNLSLIDRQTSKINEKYDAQAAALTKISDINSEIANQQKQQLGLADALSRGDIAAAAAAAQEMRATAAANAQGRQSGVLDAARAAELSGVTSGGMTRAQIEERQFQISQQSFALQQQRKVLEQSIADIEAKQIAPLNVARLAAETAIRVEEDKIYKIQQDRLVPAQAALTKAEGLLKATQDKLKADLDIIEQDKQAWADAKVARDLALLDQGAYKEALVKTEGVAKGVLDKILALNTTVKTIHNIHTVYTSSGGTGSGGSGGAKGGTQTKMYGGKIIPMNYGGMVPKYMAVGGKVGSDTVPAMLTPGEFVMNKAATKRFGPMLEGMNNSKYPSMIKDLTPTTYTNVNSSMVTPIVNNMSTTVSDNSSTMYNYNVGINVNESNASSNDIARAVIGQIKYIDSQRIRGQR
jgi:TP901 family phage tail tape measure protein